VANELYNADRPTDIIQREMSKAIVVSSNFEVKPKNCTPYLFSYLKIKAF
jgi:hypothetical protein